MARRNDCDRLYRLESNLIALLSNLDRPAVDPRRDDWFGRYSASPEIRVSGLWNVRHADERHDPAALDRLERAVGETTPP